MKFLRSLFAILLTLMCAVSSSADDLPEQDEADTLRVGQWALMLLGTLSGSQTAYQNWQEGGVDALAFTSRLDGGAVQRGDVFQQRHDLRLAFGQMKQDTLEFRKSADQIFYGFSLKYLLDGPVDPTAALEFRSQFAPGFNYDTNPFEDGRPPPVKVSDFLAPAQFTQSLGITYEPVAWFRTRVGLGTRQTIVTIARLRDLYGVHPDRSVRFQVGIESRTDLEREIFENVLFRSRLGLFAAFDDGELPDALWENLLRMQVNNWLNVDLEVTNYYDADVSRRIQIRQVLSLSASISFL